MWNWIGWAFILYILFIILEESVYFFWNRYVYGRKERKTKLVNNRITFANSFLTRLHLREVWQKYTHKIRSH